MERKCQQKSIAWIFFLINDCGSFVKCKLCLNPSYTLSLSGGSTKNMLNHLKSKHLELFNEESGKIESFAENLIAFIVSANYLPLDIVENIYFKRIVLNKIPCRETLRNMIILQFKMAKNELKENLAEINGNITLIFDGWTGRNKYHYLGLAIQYLSRSWEIKTILIDLSYSPQDSVSLARIIKEILSLYGIFDQVGYVCGDNAYVNGATIKKLKKIFLRCICHLLQLSVKAGMKKKKESRLIQFNFEN